MKILAARTAMAAAIKAITCLNGLTPIIESEGDITDQVDADLGTQGFSIVVMRPSGGLQGQTRSGSAVSLNAVIGIAILENPNVNMAAGGIGVPFEDALELIIAAIVGIQSLPDGQITMAHEPWRRLSEAEGMVVNVVGFHVPLVIRATA